MDPDAIPRIKGEPGGVIFEGSGLTGEYLAVPLPQDPILRDLTRWWMDTTYNDLQAMLPKQAEYGGTGGGSADLKVMGDALAELCGMRDAEDAVKQEMACWFYGLGKVSRLISNYQRGEPGKADTWHDLTVYSLMARRLQEHGGWPSAAGKFRVPDLRGA